MTDLRAGDRQLQLVTAVLSSISDAVVAADREGRILLWNRAAERIFGLTAAEAVGRGYDEVLLPQGERDRYAGLYERVLAGETVTVRMAGARADGSVYQREVSAAPLIAGEGDHMDVLVASSSAPAAPGGARTEGVVAIVRDVSKLVQTEHELRERASQLERSNADLEGFAYAASHELQEPLRSIKFGADTVMRAAAGRLEDDERGLLAHVEGAAARMSDQVDALMDLARVAMGHGPEEPVPVQLPLDDALDALRAAIREAGAHVDVQAPLPSAAVPRAEMTLVLQNLIANAIKFRRPGTRPHVTVTGRVRDGQVEICVGDNGVGLSEADRAQVFGIFGRAHPGIPGTGMGLAVCRQILERREGSISVSSDGPDRGTEFTLRLPAAPAAERA